MLPRVSGGIIIGRSGFVNYFRLTCWFMFAYSGNAAANFSPAFA
ncbi:hypothetical protein HanIR_Chr10g0480661 [Helianthus annuus]|nr:hypothetical protein HanIR_Chr10g0480661 [Helianthus annuus]